MNDLILACLDVIDDAIVVACNIAVLIRLALLILAIVETAGIAWGFCEPLIVKIGEVDEGAGVFRLLVCRYLFYCFAGQ